MKLNMDDINLKISKLEAEIEALKNSATIPHDIEQALRARLRISTIPILTNSTKLATSENQAVNEAGASSYNVLKAPDAFLEIVVSGATKYIPIYT